MWGIVRMIGKATKGILGFSERVMLSRAYNFSATGPLQRFSTLPGGEQPGYAIGDGRESSKLSKLVPGYFQSTFPREYDSTKRSSYIPHKGTSNAWKNSLTIADSVPNGHILVLLNPEDNIAESMRNLKSYGIHNDRLLVFIDHDDKLSPVDIKTGVVSDMIPEKFPENMRWLYERIHRYETKPASTFLTNPDFTTLVVGCADKRMNTMFDIVSPNNRGFEHLRFPGGFVRKPGISATTDPILKHYKDQPVVLISHTSCVAVREVDKGVMHDPVIEAARSYVKHACLPGCSHEVEDITSRALVTSFENLLAHGVNPNKVSMLQYDVETGLLLAVDRETGRPFKDRSLRDIEKSLIGRIEEYNYTVLEASQSKQTAYLR